MNNKELIAEARAEAKKAYRDDEESGFDSPGAAFDKGWDAHAEWQASRTVAPDDDDIQRGVKIALEEGLAGRTWPEYIRAVYNAVTARPTPLTPSPV